MRLEDIREGMRVRIVSGHALTDDPEYNLGTVVEVDESDWDGEFPNGHVVVELPSSKWHAWVDADEIEPVEVQA